MTDAVLWDPTRDERRRHARDVPACAATRRDYNLPLAPEVPTVYQRDGWHAAAFAAGGLLLAAVGCFLAGRDD